MSSKEKLIKWNEHLVSNIPNTDKNVAFIKDINKKAKRSLSRWRLRIRYRKPKEGFNYSYGGGLKRENANAFSVYIDTSLPYAQRPEAQSLSRSWDREKELKARIVELENKLLLANNPYKDLSIMEIKDKLEGVKEEIIDEYIYQIYNEDLISKYNFLTEALEIKEEENEV